MSISSCEKFKTEMAEFQVQTGEIRSFLAEYRNTGTSDIAEKAELHLEDLLARKEILIQEYSARVKDMLITWHPLSISSDDFPQEIKIEKDGRVAIDGPLHIPRASVKYFPAVIKSIKRWADLQNTQFLHADYLEAIGGNLNLDRTAVRSLNRLKHIGKTIFLHNTSLSTLPLEEAEGIFIEGGTLTSFPKLKKIRRILSFDSTIAGKESFRSLFPKLTHIGKINISGAGVYISSYNRHIEDELRALQKKGEIVIEGKIARVK